ncbi:MAG: LamG domain-containing protein, partial [Candidatus Woesearchaeota archaeon]
MKRGRKKQRYKVSSKNQKILQNLALITLVSAAMLGAYLLSTTEPTGYATLEQTKTLETSLFITEDTIVRLNLSNTPSSLKVSGSLVGTGSAKVELLSNGSRILVASIRYSEPSNLITGKAVAEATGEGSALENSTLPFETSGINIPGENETSGGDFVILSEESNASLQNLLANQTGFLNDTKEAKPDTFGDNASTDSSNHTLDRTMNVQPGTIESNITTVANQTSNETQARPDMIEVNLTGSKPAIVVITRNETKPVTDVPTSQTEVPITIFEGVCEESCSLSGVGREITLAITVSNASLNLTKIIYLEKYEKPYWNSNQTNFTVTGNTEIDLGAYFFGAEEYMVTEAENLSISLEESILTVIPTANLSGTRLVTVFASNDAGTAAQDIKLVLQSAVNLTGTINLTNQTPVQGIAEIGKPVQWTTTAKDIVVLPENARKIVIRKKDGSSAKTRPRIAGQGRQAIEIEETAEVEITYETEAPQADEEELGAGRKRIVVKSETGYENITTFTEITEAPLQSIRLYWYPDDADYARYIEKGLQTAAKSAGTIRTAFGCASEPGSDCTLANALAEPSASDENSESTSSPSLEVRQRNTTRGGTAELNWPGPAPKIDITNNPDFSVKFIDTDNDSLIERIEWITPHLSNQTFEVEITILNVQSYPMVGGKWTVAFNTTGRANLTIFASNGTTYGTGIPDDLEFLGLQCGEQLLDPVFNGTHIFLENYECNNTGYHTVTVNTGGSHTQQFNFGGQTAYAYNWAGWINVSLKSPPTGTNTLDSNITLRCLAITNSTKHVLKNVSLYTNTGGTWTRNKTIDVREIQPGENDLVLLMHFNNDSSVGENQTRFYDWSRKGNNGRCSGTGCPVYNLTNRMFGKALNFDGGNDIITISDSPTFSGSSAMSFMTWIYFRSLPTATGTDAMIFSLDYDGAPWYVFYLFVDTDDNTISFVVVTDGGETWLGSKDALKANKWYHVAGVYNGTEMLLYVNGTYNNAYGADLTGKVLDSTEVVTIGNHEDLANGVKGALDEVAIFNRTISPAEIKSYYNYTRTRYQMNTTMTGISDGSYKWNCLAFDNASSSDWGNSNWTFTKFSYPLTILKSPTSGTSITDTNVTLRCNAT